MYDTHIFTLFRCFPWSKWVQEDLWISLCKAWVWFQLRCHPQRADSSSRAAAPRNTGRGWESSELFSELGGVAPWGPTLWKRCWTRASERLSKNWTMPQPRRLQSKQTAKAEISRGKQSPSPGKVFLQRCDLAQSPSHSLAALISPWSRNLAVPSWGWSTGKLCGTMPEHAAYSPARLQAPFLPQFTFICLPQISYQAWYFQNSP